MPPRPFSHSTPSVKLRVLGSCSPSFKSQLRIFSFNHAHRAAGGVAILVFVERERVFGGRSVQLTTGRQLER
eukprot:633239-Rhodomonas_salina.1